MSSRMRSRPDLVDALGHVADLDPVGHVGAERRPHVGLGPLGEVLAQLVADDGRAGAQDGHGERARAHARLEHTLARADVRRDEDGAEVLGVDDLGAAGHLEDDVAERRTQRQEAAPGRAGDGATLGRPDDVVVGQHAGVGVEGRPGHERQEVAAVLGVDEEHALPRREGARHGRQASTGGCGVAVAHRDEHLLARGDRDGRDGAGPVVQDPAQEEGGAGQEEPVPVPGQPPPDPGAQEAPQEHVHVRAAGSRRRPTWPGPAGGRPGRPA